MPARVLGEAEDAGEIYVDDFLPELFGVLGCRGAADDTGVVDQNVDCAEVPDGLFDQTRADLSIAYITDQCGGFDACGGDFLLRRFRCFGGAVDGDIGAGLSERDGNGCAKTARGAGDQSGFALEIEFVEYQKSSGPFGGVHDCSGRKRGQNRGYTRALRGRNRMERRVVVSFGRAAMY